MDRSHGIGGSDARRIMDGDWLALWEEKTGRRTPEDLSGVLPVQIGIVTEDLNLRWFEQQTGQQVYRDKCDDLVHPEHGFMRGNLDGRVGAGVIECKHVSAFTKDEAVVSRYYPQVQHYLALTGGDIAFLSVIWGNHRWDFFEVDPDPGYQEQLIDREAAFWHHVEHDIPPEDTGAAEVEVAFDAMRSVDMTGHNRWAALAGDWLETRRAATVFTDATKGLKALVESDVKLASGHGVKVTRARNGALTVRELH